MADERQNEQDKASPDSASDAAGAAADAAKPMAAADAMTKDSASTAEAPATDDGTATAATENAASELDASHPAPGPPVPPGETKPKKPRKPRTRKSGPALPRIRKDKPGTQAGLDRQQLLAMPRLSGSAGVTCIDYCEDHVEIQPIDDIEDFIIHHRPSWVKVRWINIDGLKDPHLIQAFAEKYELHPLAIEDVMHIPQRPKVDSYGGTLPGDHPSRLFVIVRMMELRENRIYSEQISMFLGRSTLLTFQETPGDVWDPIRARIQKTGSQLRANDASFLAYSLLDAIVDHCYPILERYGDRLEDLEDGVFDRPRPEVIHEIHQLRRELLLLRRDVWPMREVIHHLQREPHECLSDATRTYLRDVYDHTVQIIDLIETYREVGTALTETYISSVGIRMNEVIKVLTVMGTIFIPITFLASVYGMNFQHFPELHWRYGYAMFWVICLVISLTMLAWFRKRKWL